MAGIIKPLGLANTVGTSSTTTFGGAKLLRLTYTSASTTSCIITCKTQFTFNANTDVDSTTEFISIANHIFKDLDAVVYSIDSGNTALTGLTNGTTYYVTASNTAGIKLSLTSGGAANNITKGKTESGHNLKRTNYTVSLTGGQSILLEKNSVDVLTSDDNSNLSGTAIAYKS